MSDNGTIATNPNLPTAQNYLQLRQQALAYLQQTGQAAWTDYNLHDPGITFMELLAYGITDLGYRQDMPIPNLLAVDINGNINGNSQTLYTPRQILTTSPLTVHDYRLLLMNVTGVQNAWLTIINSVSTQCGMPLYIDCKDRILSYNQTNPSNQTNTPIIYGGLYDVTLLLDSSSSGLGNLNSGSVVYPFLLPFLPTDSIPGSMSCIDLADSYAGYVEARFLAPSLVLTDPQYQDFIAAGTTITGITGPASASSPGTYGPVIIASDTLKTPAYLPGGLQNTVGTNLYANAVIHYTTATCTSGTLEIDNIPFKVYFTDVNANMVVTVADLTAMFSEFAPGGIFATYQSKLQQVEGIIEGAKFALNEHRNYCEDFCNLSLVQTEDYAICCDIQLSNDADQDQVQAGIYAGIINYFNPPVKFYTLSEMVQAGYSTDQIFNGPRTAYGFVKPEDLINSTTPEVIYTSEIIKIMYTVPGVEVVSNFTIARIDANGNRIAAAPWQMTVTTGMLPNFYIFGSRINFYKNTFLYSTDLADVINTVALIESANVNPKLQLTDLDVALPQGQMLNLSDYYPLMYSLPQVYNVSPVGPMPPLTNGRLSQAHQLQAYLFFFEQIYADWLGQIDNLKNFFNVEDPSLRTYISQFIGETDLQGVSDLYAPGYNLDMLQSNWQSTDEFNDRKNRIYNHLMARFGENFEDYVMISNTVNSSSPTLAPAQAITEKARLLRKYPADSYRKARALNYKYNTRFTQSIVHEGLIDKYCDLMGLDSLNDFFHWAPYTGNPAYNYQLVGSSPNAPVSIAYKIFLNIPVNSEPPAVMSEGYYDQCINWIDAMLDPSTGGGPRQDVDGQYYIMGGITGPGNSFTETCRVTTAYGTLSGAWAAYQNLPAQLNRYWVANMILPIEHILLRPWFSNEPTLNTCIPKDCVFCGDEDPYSFRMTFVMCGEQGYPGADLNFRAFAENLIRNEIPAHLLIKVCWLSAWECEALTCYYRNYINLVEQENNPAKVNAPCPGSGSGSGSGHWGGGNSGNSTNPNQGGNSGSGNLPGHNHNSGSGSGNPFWANPGSGSGSGNPFWANHNSGSGSGNPFWANYNSGSGSGNSFADNQNSGSGTGNPFGDNQNSGISSGNTSGSDVNNSTGSGNSGWQNHHSGSGSGYGWPGTGWIGGYTYCSRFALNGLGSGCSGSGSGLCYDGSVAEARAMLVNQLNSIRSIYPAAIMNNCDDGSPAQLVYLGKTVI